MKKTIILLFSLIFMGQLFAQEERVDFYGYDTLWATEREPTYYYWDTFWYDKYIFSPNHQDVEWRCSYLGELDSVQAEYARYCYTDSSLRVIGIAAVLFTLVMKNDDGSKDPWENTFPEYLRLYEVDSTNDSMILLSSKPIGRSPRYIHCLEWNSNPLIHYSEYSYNPLFEVFFDSAITVHDSFYVSVTENNTYEKKRKRPYYFFLLEAAQGIQYGHTQNADYKPTPNHFRRKLHRAPDERQGYMSFSVTDTNWHTFSHVYRKANGKLGPEFSAYPCIFAIIDTSHFTVDTTCDKPSDLGIMDIEPRQAMLSWNGTGASMWELSVAQEDGNAESGAKTLWNEPVATVTGLEPNTWYRAWVRSVCDSTHSSPWSQSIRFSVPDDDDTTHTEAIETIADSYTHLMPNPTKDYVTVISSFRINTVELWTLTGKLALRQKADAISTILDVATLPRGTYIARITTNHGISYKKLVVE